MTFAFLWVTVVTWVKNVGRMILVLMLKLRGRELLSDESGHTPEENVKAPEALFSTTRRLHFHSQAVRAKLCLTRRPPQVRTAETILAYPMK